MEEAEYCDRLGMIYRGELISIGTPEELKTEQMKDDVLEVQCFQPHEAMSLIAKIPDVKEAALFGTKLHVVTESSENTRKSIETLLPAQGFSVAKIEQIVPSMEDVFVSLVENRDRAEQPQKEVRG
jgi:ABC-2 type transport system ATP-binding protein